MFSNGFRPLLEAEHAQGIKVGGRGFQKLKEPLRETPGISAILHVILCDAQIP
jgi:hypothetical protein